jgi:hypothetical protein
MKVDLARLRNINNGPHPDIQDTMDTIIPLEDILDRFRPPVMRELSPPQHEESSGFNAATKTLQDKEN